MGKPKKTPDTPIPLAPGVIRLFEQELPVRLSSLEVDEASKELATKQLELERIREIKRAVMRQYREQQQNLDDRIHELSVQVNDGIRTVVVPCREVSSDDGSFVVRVIRDDTGAVLSERPMTLEERQTEMFGAPGLNGSGEHAARTM